MNFEKSLNSALEELWRAAVSMSALKYIASVVKAEISVVSNRDDERITQQHDQILYKPDQFENSNARFAKEITLNPEDAAIENEVHDQEYIFADEEESLQTEEDEEVHRSSVSHAVTTPDSLGQRDNPLLTSSMLAHSHSLPEQTGWLTSVTSLRAHTCEDQCLVPAQECQENVLPDEKKSHLDTVTMDGKVHVIISMAIEENVAKNEETEGNKFYLETYEAQEIETETRNNNLNHMDFIDQFSNVDEDHFLISMVSHQLPYLAPSEEYQTAIISSAAHQYIQIETEEMESSTTMLSHFTDNFYDSGNIESVNEEEPKEITEDALYDFTEYTEVDHLDTMKEVSEMCDITDAEEMTESDMFEDTEDFSLDNQVQTFRNIEDKIIPKSNHQPDSAQSYSFHMSYGNVTSDYCPYYTEDDQSFIEEEESYSSEYHDPNIECKDPFLLSMVTHQLPIHDTPLQFQTYITSMSSHMSASEAADYKCTTNLSHFTRCYSGIAEEEPEQEATEDFTEYTDVYTEDHLDTIQEVSEICDTTDQTEMTETEMFEEIEEYICFSENKDLNSITLDIQETYSTIQESTLEEESEEETAYITENEEETRITDPEQDENVFYQDEVNEEEGVFMCSLVSHCVDTREENYLLLPSPASHNINTATETQDFSSLVQHQQPCHNSKFSSVEKVCQSEIGLSEDSKSNLRKQKEAEFLSEDDSMLPQEYQSCREPVISSTSISINEQSGLEDGKNTVQSYKLQLTRIQELQKLVDDEIQEFDSKKKYDPNNIEQATENQIVNIVKGVEFVTNIKIHQMLEPTAEKESIGTEADDKLKSIKQTVELFSEEEEEASDVNNSSDNLICASCTLRGDNTVSIRSSYAGSDDLEMESSADFEDSNNKEGDEDELNELKIQIRAPPRKSVRTETKIRDNLDSLFAETQKTDKPKNIQMTDNNEAKKDLVPKPSILKPSKTNVKVASASLNESSSKQSYRIKFKVKLNENSQRKQTSVLRYLFGCFGGEKLFNLQHK